jgi:4-hydroxy 2-oxovalerate aldolase
MKVLDCTLRDGGYYNSWDFEEDLVASYLSAIAEAGVEFVELGLRNFGTNGFKGPFAYTTERFLEQLNLPEGPTYGVMVDAKTLIESGYEPDLAVEKLFVPEIESKIGLVRIAAHFHEVEACGPFVEKLKQLGYLVGFNLMQAGGKPSELIAQKASIATSWSGLDVLYFADSLGNMDSDEVSRIITALKTSWSGELGIHTHDNMSKGLANSMSALRLGVEWLDSTVTGMGRGAGNTQTEYLLGTLNDHIGNKKYNPEPIYNVVIKYFESLQKECGWGSNLSYFLAAKNGIHPTYIQNMLASSHYKSDEIVAAIQYLIDLKGTEKYSSDVLSTALTINSADSPVSGTTELEEKFSGKEVLIVSGGPSTLKYKKAISAYIEAKSPIVFCVNIVDGIDNIPVDYYCVTHNTTYLSQSDQYQSLEAPLIAPVHRFRSEELTSISKIIDYGLEKANSFDVGKSSCKLPKEMTIGYAIAAAIAGNAKHISLVGVDGYAASDPRQQDMIDLLTDISLQIETDICALTPTNYPIEKRSIYALV